MKPFAAAIAALGMLAFSGLAQAGEGCDGGAYDQQTSKPSPTVGS